MFNYEEFKKKQLEIKTYLNTPKYLISEETVVDKEHGIYEDRASGEAYRLTFNNEGKFSGIRRVYK